MLMENKTDLINKAALYVLHLSLRIKIFSLAAQIVLEEQHLPSAEVFELEVKLFPALPFMIPQFSACLLLSLGLKSLNLPTV